MQINFQIIKWIICLEFILVVLMVLIACMLKFIFSIKQKRSQKLLINTENYLHRLLENTSLFSVFPKKAKKMNVLLPIINKFDETLHSQNWNKLKAKIGEEILHKLAKKNATHRRWRHRFLAAECFKVYAVRQDEDFLVKLIKDKFPLVTLSASVTAIKLGTAKLINALIDRMSQERRLTLTMFLMLFENASSEIYHIVSDRLNNERNPFIRTSCYKILQKLPATQKIENFHNDLQTNNLELKLSVLHYISYAQCKDAVLVLKKMLKDKEWEVSSVAVRLLGNLGAVEAISEISNMLENPEWWVRLNAALALKKLGNEGIIVLKTQNPDKDRYAYEVAQHVLQYADNEVIRNG
jgi:HEAT repeat protein